MSPVSLQTLLLEIVEKLRLLSPFHTSRGRRGRRNEKEKSLRSTRHVKERATISHNNSGGGGTQQRQLQALARRAGIASRAEQSSAKARRGEEAVRAAERRGEGRGGARNTTPLSAQLPVSKRALSVPPSSHWTLIRSDLLPACLPASLHGRDIWSQFFQNRKKRKENKHKKCLVFPSIQGERSRLDLRKPVVLIGPLRTDASWNEVEKQHICCFN